MTEAPLPDREERERIHADLETNLLVEAGAGSGKTTELLTRMVALIRNGGAGVDEIAAVTFTRKAAAELRERFQTELEVALREAREKGDGPTVERLNDAVEAIDRSFIGTIHSFCARLLRERPIDVGLDPSFREIFGPEEERLRRDAWFRYLERLTTEGDLSLRELESVNLHHLHLQRTYELLVEHPDVLFAADPVNAPEAEPLRSELEALLKEGLKLLPDREPPNGWDSLQKRLRGLRRSRFSEAWKDHARFFDALEIVVDHSLKVSPGKWGDNGRAAHKLGRRLEEFAAPGGPAEGALRRWHAHRYPIALRFAKRAADEFKFERRHAGLLSFNDLLMRAAELLKRSPSARRDLRERYRYLLVDEFQDTDPVQAEVVFLLAADDPEETDWRKAVPRDGALFVVGDPKQSIYRFRRADIAIYNQVKARFREFGDVVELTANFRSLPPIEQFVNGVFKDLLPTAATQNQAAFAPLNVQKPEGKHQGVYWYRVHTKSRNATSVARADAAQLASWIEARLQSGERKPRDFMILTYRKPWLQEYAAALEKRNIPVQVTGAGVDIGGELDEVVAVLRALADPDNPVLTIAALVGPFFGLDHEQLAAHRLAGANFRLDRPIDEPASGVEEALARLNGWWRLTRTLPADIAVGTIINDIGLLPYAAAGDLGESSAGALSFILNAVRQAGLNGDSSLNAALDAIQEALVAEDVEAPLQPGRDNVVRVMNLHKAKGLEAPVVVLAHPTGVINPPASYYIDRAEPGDARGYLEIDYKSGPWSYTRLACPADWDDLAGMEQPFQDAENVRLLYVASTRAQEELVISYCESTEKKSPWAPFYPYRDMLFDEIEIHATEAPERRELDVPAEQICAEVETLRQKRVELTMPRYQIGSVSKLVKPDEPALFPVDDAGRGSSWGNAVHQALEAAGRGTDGERLRALCRTVLLENDLPIDQGGEPEELEELVGLVERVKGSDTWRRAHEAERVLFEAPFALPIGDGEVGEGIRIVEGVIDLVFREPDGWVIVDYKTDVVGDRELLRQRVETYRDQVDIYAICWEGLTGERVKERRLLLLGHDREEVW